MNTLTYNVEINIIATLAASVITYVAVVVYRLRVPSFANILFWRKFAKGLVIVISEVPFPYDPPSKRGEQPPLTPMGDALVLSEFLRFFQSRRYTMPTVVTAQSFEGLDHIKHQNILVIGGPKYNFAARECLYELDDVLPYQFRRLRPRDDKRTIRDVNYKKFVGRGDLPELVPQAAQDLDYGMAVLAPSPYNNEREVLILGGLSNLSTLAVMTWLQKAGPVFWIRLSRKAGFQAMVQCRNIATTRVSNVKPRAVHYLERGK